MYFKGHYQDYEKTTFRIGKKYFTNQISDKGLVSRLYEELMYSTVKWYPSHQQWDKYLDRPFSKEDVLVVNKHMKRWLILLSTREKQIKTQRHYYFMFRVAKIKSKFRSGQALFRTGSNWASYILGIYICWEFEVAQLFRKTCKSSTKMLQLSYEPEILLLDMQKRNENVRPHKKLWLCLERWFKSYKDTCCSWRSICMMGNNYLELQSQRIWHPFMASTGTAWAQYTDKHTGKSTYTHKK